MQPTHGGGADMAADCDELNELDQRTTGGFFARFGREQYGAKPRVIPKPRAGPPTPASPQAASPQAGSPQVGSPLVLPQGMVATPDGTP